MKNLLLIRHAKSDWPINTQDFDRPLSEKGILDAKKMSKFLLKEKIIINQMITSPAKRAKTTCSLFAETYQMNYSEDADLYLAQNSEFINVISKADENTNSLALFSHNDGISEFASSLCGDSILFKTCAVAIFELKTDTWKNFKENSIFLKDYITPKETI